MTSNSHEPTRAIPIAGLTFLCSLGTGVLWNALYFIAASEYGFTQRDNLVLALVNGILYTVVAVNAGRTLRFLENRMCAFGRNFMEHDVVGNDVEVIVGEFAVFRQSLRKMHFNAQVSGAHVRKPHHRRPAINAPHFGIGEALLQRDSQLPTAGALLQDA